MRLTFAAEPGVAEQLSRCDTLDRITLKQAWCELDPWWADMCKVVVVKVDMLASISSQKVCMCESTRHPVP